MTAPDVSVVVISYNDAGRLPRAIRSVQRQTLRALEIVVVDDASTDDTQAVVRRLADDDPRIRYERLDVNSGGCSAPRNRGMALATAPWVMFCDSDDEYDRHACKNLLQAAERLDADIVCGTAERIDVATGRRRRWRPEVHDVVRVADGLLAFPELLYDTISVNKIYRRSMLAAAGIAFPEGLLFEDQLFTLEAFAGARRLAAIPETVYLWYVDRLSEEPSITQRRQEVRNVDSRIEINRRIDAFLAERDLVAIQRLKDEKFLRHDLYLYLSSMLDADDGTATELMERLRPYVASIEAPATVDLRPALRVAVYHLLLGDLSGVRAAMRTVKWASTVGVPIEADGDREFWACEHLRGGPQRSGVGPEAWLDITDLAALAVPFTQRRYQHVLDSLVVDGDLVSATGTTVDFDGSLGGLDGIELRFLIHGDRTVASVPAAWTTRDGARWGWRAQGRVTPGLRRRLEQGDRGTVGLAMRRGPHINVMSARAGEQNVPVASVPYRGAARRAGPDTLVLGPHDNGAVGWKAARRTRRHRRAAAWRDRWFRVPGSRALAQLTSDALPGVLQRLGAVLPARRLVVFEYASGRAVGGVPLAISERLRDLHPRVAQAWVRRSAFTDVPGHAEAVERYSLRHQWLMVRAGIWVDDGTSPLTVRRPRHTQAVVTGDGVPVTRRGLDDPGVLVDRASVREVRRRAARTTLALAASDASAEVLRSALGFTGPVAITGLAAAERAIGMRTGADGGAGGVRASLDLPDDRRIVLYAPASRSDSREPTAPLVDLQQWRAALGAETYLLLHVPPPERVEVSTRLRSAVRDVSDLDLAALLAACDLLVSDYASVIGDAVACDLPVVVFQPDREVYVNRTHGLYADLAPVGPAVESQGALEAEVRRWLADPPAWATDHATSRRDWARRWCGTVDGRSGERSVAAILRGRWGS